MRGFCLYLEVKENVNVKMMIKMESVYAQLFWISSVIFDNLF